MKDLVFEDNDIIVEINTDEDAYLCALKCREELVCAIKITINKKIGADKKYIGTYFKTWGEDDPFNPIIYNSFIEKFLKDVNFRKDLEVDGEHWVGIIPCML